MRDDLLRDPLEDDVAVGVIAMMMRVDQPIDRPVLRPLVQAVEEELRRIPVLTVDDSDAGGIDQVADGPATGGEEADIAPDGREDRRDLRRRLLPGAKDRRAP